MNYIYILLTILFTVYGQLILKWRIAKYGALPEQLVAKFWFIIKLFIDPFILSGFISAFAASICWMAAMTKFEISYAYPFMSFSFLLVVLLSVFLFGETLTLNKVIGLLFIITGIVVTYKGN